MTEYRLVQHSNMDLGFLFNGNTAICCEEEKPVREIMNRSFEDFKKRFSRFLVSADIQENEYKIVISTGEFFEGKIHKIEKERC